MLPFFFFYERLHSHGDFQTSCSQRVASFTPIGHVYKRLIANTGQRIGTAKFNKGEARMEMK